jgi:hypothetical protein
MTAPCPGKSLRLLRSRKRPARTPPSTFLFLPIHLSNIPEPCGSVDILRQAPKPLKPITSDAATRTWPRLYGRMLGHRVNSEGLRRRTIARGGGAPKRVYIVFALHYCQPSGSENMPCGPRETGNSCRVWRSDSRTAAPRQNAYAQREFAVQIHPFGALLRRTAATFLRRSSGCRLCRNGDKRQLHLSFRH